MDEKRNELNNYFQEFEIIKERIINKEIEQPGKIL